MTSARELDLSDLDEFDTYAFVRRVAEEHPGVARKAARDGTRAHYRNDHPFDYSVSDDEAACTAGGQSP
jgi:hypothetical protein